MHSYLCHIPPPLSFSILQLPPRSTLFPYTTLFRSSSVNSRERSGINTILHELNPLFTINVTMRDIKSKNVTFMVNSGLSSRSEERFSRNAETDLVCRLLLEKKKEINVIGVQGRLTF